MILAWWFSAALFSVVWFSNQKSQFQCPKIIFFKIIFWLFRITWVQVQNTRNVDNNLQIYRNCFFSWYFINWYWHSRMVCIFWLMERIQKQSMPRTIWKLKACLISRNYIGPIVPQTLSNSKFFNIVYTIYVWRNKNRPPNANDISRMCRNANNVKKVHLLIEFEENERLNITKLEWGGVRKTNKKNGGNLYIDWHNLLSGIISVV